MALTLYNTLAREKQTFTPIDPKRVTLYVCGPTVYSYAHIGNARAALVGDMVFRMLRHQYGADHVVYARNITDVDDKINAAAAEQSVDISVITNKFAKIYQDDMRTLGMLDPTLEPRATDHIPEMIETIQNLLDNDHAYQAEGHVLFATQSFDDYGQLSNRNLDDMIAGSRVEVAPYKKHPTDFVLWKPSKDGEPVWNSPFGPGRPGWHLECTAMIAKNLGLPFDIHGGGHDLVFPHHENEIAQGRCAHKTADYANYWVHNGFLTMDSDKMSKSLGNCTLVHDLIQDHKGEVLRWALLSAHYRGPLDWTQSALEQAKAALDKLYGALSRVGHLAYMPSEPAAKVLAPLLDDINTPQAMSALFAIAKRIELTDSDDEKTELKSQLITSGQLMGFFNQTPDQWFAGDTSQDDANTIETLIKRRNHARSLKQWDKADAARDELTKMGIELLDGPDGTTWRKM